LKEIGGAGELYVFAHSTNRGRFGPALVLAPEATDMGLVTSEDILGLGCQPKRRVVLAACDTTQGRQASGVGSFGLAGAFLATGTTEVLATIGVVSDVAGNLVAEKIRDCDSRRRLATCLREAQRSLMSDNAPMHSSPASWGRFVVVTEG
jgi:CHAT domain-containing protein